MKKIKVTVDMENHVEAFKFPCIMIANNGDIMRFSKSGKGALLVAGSGRDIYSWDETDDWNMSNFIPFKGKLILENVSE